MVTKRVIKQFTEIPRHDAPTAVDELTDRERDVFRLIARGLSNGEIGRELFISDTTVKTHVTHVFNRHVAAVLNEAGLGTLLFDLLTPEEERDRANVFDIGLLAGRLAEVTGWLRAQPRAARAAGRLLRRQHRRRGGAVGGGRARRRHRGRGVPRRPPRPGPPPARRR